MRPFFQHTHQEANNRILEFTENQGTVQRIFQKRFLSEDVEQLFEYITSILYTARKPLISYQNFTLVNIYSPMYHFSHGFCPPPPQEVIYPASSLIITFALKRQYYDEDLKWNRHFKVRYPHWSFMWGEDLENRHNYFTISVPLLKVRQCRLRALLPNNMFYLYNTLSTMTKNWITHQYYYPFMNNMFYNYGKFFNMKFPDLMRRHYYKQLTYLKWTWYNATNLINIDYNAALYYFLYIDNLPLTDRTEGDMLSLKLFGDEGSIQYQLKESIRLYNTDREELNLILVAALYGKSNNAKDYFTRLSKIHNQSNLILSENDAEDIIRKNLTATMLEDEEHL